MNHLRSQFFRKGAHHFHLPVYVTAVADDPAQTDAALTGIPGNTLGYIVRRIKSHHFTAGHDIDFLRLSFSDRHRKAAAHDVAQHIVENIIQIVCICAKTLQQADGRDNASSGAAYPWFGTAGFHTSRAFKAFFENRIQFNILAILPESVKNRSLRQST